MSDTIEPVMTVDDWGLINVGAPGAQRANLRTVLDVDDSTVLVWNTDARDSMCDIHSLAMPMVIAVLNAQLPTDDPRKITRETIDLLRGTAEHSDNVETWRMGPLGWRTRLLELANALESYLPPA